MYVEQIRICENRSVVLRAACSLLSDTYQEIDLNFATAEFVTLEVPTWFTN